MMLLHEKQVNSAIQQLQYEKQVQILEQKSKLTPTEGNNAIISNRHMHEYAEMLRLKSKSGNKQTSFSPQNNKAPASYAKLRRMNTSNGAKLAAYSSFIQNNGLKAMSTASHRLDSILVHSKEYNSDTQDFTSEDFRVEYEYNDAHFNNLMTVKLRKPDNSLENYFKYEYTLDVNGYVNSESYYEWVENAWVGVEKQQVVVDTNGYLLSVTWSVWDTTNVKWIEEEKLETTYDTQYNVLLDLSSLWNSASSTWEPVHKIEYAYTAEIGMTKQVYANYNPDTQAWAIYQFSEDTYNAEMEILSRIMYTEYYGYKSEYEYDQYKNLTASRDYDLDIASGTWNKISDVVMEYNAHKKMLSFQSKFYWGDYVNPSNGERKKYTYNEQNQLLSETIWNWDSYEKLDYIPYREEVITRTDSVSSVVSYWGTAENDWLPSKLGVYNMDKNGGIIRYTELFWNSIDTAWENSAKTEYLLDDKANIIEESTSYWTGNAWGSYQRTLFAYTDKKQVSKLYKYDWNSAQREWIMVRKEETQLDTADRILYYLYLAYSDEGNYGYTNKMEYDKKGRTLLYLNHSWDTENNEWKMTYHTEERYNTDDLEIMRITLYWDFDGINYFYNGFKSENFYDDKKHMNNQVLSNYDNSTQKWAVIAEATWNIDYTVSTDSIYLPVDIYEGSNSYKVDEVLYTGKHPVSKEMITIEKWVFFYTKLNTVSVNTLNQTNPLKVYPNPFANELRVEVSEICTQIQILAADGSVVKTQIPQASSIHIQADDLKPGLYFMVCTFRNGQKLTQKLIKQ